MHGIPPSLIINIDQTHSKYVSSSRTTMAKKNSKQVAVGRSTDKRTITATFAVKPYDGKFLPMQLIYGGKTKQSLPRFKFPDSFSLSVNPTHTATMKNQLTLSKTLLCHMWKNNVPYWNSQTKIHWFCYNRGQK